MSTPTPGSDPSYPPEGTPTGQPGWTAPPPAQGYGVQNPQGYGAGPQYPQGYGAPTAQRPSQVTAAAVIGIVIGALGILGLFRVGLYFDFDAVLGLLSLLAVAAAVLTLVGGIQAIQGSSPRLLMLGSYASIGVQLLTIIWALVSGYGFVFLGMVGFLLPAIIVFLLMQPQSKQYFASRGITY